MPSQMLMLFKPYMFLILIISSLYCTGTVMLSPISSLYCTGNVMLSSISSLYCTGNVMLASIFFSFKFYKRETS